MTDFSAFAIPSPSDKTNPNGPVAPNSASVERTGSVSVQFGPDGERTITDGTGYGDTGYTSRPGEIANGETGILATARSATFGSIAAASALKPNDRVTVQGIEMTVRDAERLGMLKPSQAGGYEATNNPTPTQEPSLRDDYADRAHPELFSEQEEAFVSSLPQNSLAAVVASIMATGAVSEKAIGSLVTETGVDPAQASRMIGQALAPFTAQASRRLAAYGITDGEDFAAWAQSCKPNDWKAAMQRHHIERSTAGYDGLAKGYLAHVHDHDLASILEADFGKGVTVRKSGSTAVLNIPGVGEVGFKAALSMGLVGPGRR